MTIRKTCIWFFALVLTVIAGGGGYAYWFLSNSNEMIRATLIAKLNEAAPGWDVDIPEARLDLWGRVRIYNLTFKEDQNVKAAITLPETIVVVDRGRLAEQELVIQQMRFLRPELTLIRDRAGHWNVEGIQLPQKQADSQPEILVEQAKVTLRIVNPEGVLSPPVVLQELNLKLTPDGKGLYDVGSRFQLAQSDAVEINGKMDLAAKTWEATGSVEQLKIAPKLIHELAGFFPTQVQKLGEQARKYLDAAGSKTRGNGEPVDQILRAVQLTAAVDVKFSVKQWKPNTVPEFGAKLTVSQGQLGSVALPFELHDLQGDFFVKNNRVLVERLSARNGPTQLQLSGQMVGGARQNPGRFDVRVTNLALDQRLRKRLPKTWHKFYDDIKPTGTIDIVADLIYRGAGKWDKNSTVTLKDCSATHVKFDYRVDHINGIVTQDGPLLIADLQGKSGQREMGIKARVTNPGPAAESIIDFHVERLPIDQKLITACNAATQKTLKSMQLRGTFDADVRLHRPPGLGKKHRPHLIGHLNGCSMTYAAFPYELKNVTGSVEWDSANWTFEDLKATHGVAQLSGAGRFEKQGTAGLLDLDIVATNAAFDEDLFQALPPGMRTVRDEFQPKGRFNLDTHVSWTPGSPPVVDIHDLALNRALVKLRSFPFLFENVTGHVSVITDRATDVRKIKIHHLKANHDGDKNIELSGAGNYDSTGAWHIEFEKLTIDDLDTGTRFRKALPNGVREFFEATDPRGASISAVGGLALRGTPDGGEPIVTAAWDIDIFHSGTTITAGVDLEDLYGLVHFSGEWDGETMTGNGMFDLNSVTIYGYQFTNVSGPMTINRDQFVIGSQAVASGQRPTDGPQAPKLRERVTANFIGGNMVLDGIATLDDDSGYLVKVQLRDGRLEQYAKQYGPRQKKLRGIINGDVTFDGRGARPESFHGKGRVTISPAALYELPTILALTKTLSFLPPEKTAFDRADIFFDVNSREFNFSRIDLVGDALSLSGRGRVRLVDKSLDLDFYSTAPRNQFPIVGPFLAKSTEGWIRVHVSGTTSDPRSEEKFLPTLDGPLRGFLGIMTPPPRSGRAPGRRTR